MKKLIIAITLLFSWLINYAQLKPVVGVGYRHYLTEIHTAEIKSSPAVYLGFKKQLNQRFNIGFGLQTNINTEEANRSAHYSDYENGAFIGDTTEYCYQSYNSLNFVLPVRLYYNVFKSKILLSAQLGLFIDDLFRLNETFSNDDFIKSNGDNTRTGFFGFCYNLGFAYNPIKPLTIECKYGKLNGQEIQNISIIELELNYTINIKKE